MKSNLPQEVINYVLELEEKTKQLEEEINALSGSAKDMEKLINELLTR